MGLSLALPSSCPQCILALVLIATDMCFVNGGADVDGVDVTEWA